MFLMNHVGDCTMSTPISTTKKYETNGTERAYETEGKCT